MLEGYKAIAEHIAQKHRLTFDHNTVRSWKRSDGLPIQKARRKVYIPSDVFDAWFVRTILGRA